MQQTQFINGVLWGELTTSVTIRRRLDRTRRSGVVRGPAAPAQRADRRRPHRSAGLRGQPRSVRHLPGVAARRGRATPRWCSRSPVPTSSPALPTPCCPPPARRTAGSRSPGRAPVRMTRRQPGGATTRSPCPTRSGRGVAGDGVHPAAVQPDQHACPELGHPGDGGRSVLTSSGQVPASSATTGANASTDWAGTVR